jgi:hypothetical protein
MRRACALIEHNNNTIVGRMAYRPFQRREAPSFAAALLVTMPHRVVSKPPIALFHMNRS